MGGDQLLAASRSLGGAPVSPRALHAGAPRFDPDCSGFFTFQTRRELTPCDQGRRCEYFLLPLFLIDIICETGFWKFFQNCVCPLVQEPIAVVSVDFAPTEVTGSKKANFITDFSPYNQSILFRNRA